MYIFNPSSKLWLEAHPSATPAASAAASGLKISGKVGTETSYKDAELKAMPTIKAQATNKDGTKTDYSGVPIKSLLETAKPAADATTLVLIGSDGYKVEVPLKDALACDQCIVAFVDPSGYTTVMPNFAKNTQVKGVVELQVK
jgi:DMSO/TMAO reductase YedYZ molybdopterin-dependent catalytic subunit